MFEDALLESFPQRSVLSRIHYLIAALTGVLVFALGMRLATTLLAPAGERALVTAALLLGAVAALEALLLCYTGADARRHQWPAWPWLGVVLLLSLPGFLIYLVYAATKTNDWRRAAVPLAYVAQSLVAGVLIVVPLIHTQALPTELLIATYRIPLPPSGPPPHPTGEQARPLARRATVDPFAQPAIIPNGVMHIVEAPAPPEVEAGTGPYVPGALPGFGAGSGTIPGGVPWGSQPPPPPAPRAAPRPQRVRLPSDIVAAKAIYQPKPLYPQIAMMAHIQGKVVLAAIIGKDGAIQDLKLVSGPPLLAQAALDVVRTWRYQPTLLNAEPVEVMTEIDVIFTLEQ